MSMARVTTVTKSMKPGECEKCGTQLPKGSAYRHFKVGFRSRHKHVRCMDPKCTPRPSELESSLIAEVYAAQESASDQLDTIGGDADDMDAVRSAVEEVTEALRSVASQYDEASTDANGNEWNTEAAERRDVLESAADELEGFDPDDHVDETDCGVCGGSGGVQDPNVTVASAADVQTVPCGFCGGTGEVKDYSEVAEAARTAIDEVELP